MKQVQLKDVKRGQWFTFTPSEYPSYNAVYVRDDYDRGAKKYGYYRYSDVNHYKQARGTRAVYVDFIF